MTPSVRLAERWVVLKRNSTSTSTPIPPWQPRSWSGKSAQGWGERETTSKPPAPALPPAPRNGSFSPAHLHAPAASPTMGSAHGPAARAGGRRGCSRRDARMVGPVLFQELLLGSRRNRLYVLRWCYGGWLLLQLSWLYF